MNITQMRAERRERRQIRAEYDLQADRLETVLACMAETPDREVRAGLLDAAAELVTALAELHTGAWGRDEDATGRPASLSLRGSAVLLERVARTERSAAESTFAVIHGGEYPDAIAETWLWAELSGTTDPARRAVLLRTLRAALAEEMGANAVDVLDVIASTERPAGARQDRDRNVDGRAYFVLPRVVLAAVFVLIAGVIVVPSPAPAMVLPWFAGALAVIAAADGVWARLVLPRLAARTARKQGAGR